MKKAFLFISLVVLSITAFSQDLRFTKGEIAPGKFQNGREFENFITGVIKISDATGNTFRFEQAELMVKSKEGKDVLLTIKGNTFSAAEQVEILQYGRDGAIYTFTSIVVTDNTGKRITLAKAEFIYDPYQR